MAPRETSVRTSLPDLALDRPVTTLMVLLSLMVLGTVSMFLLPLDFMPMVEEPEVRIHVPFPGSHPLESLRQIAQPIEEEVATIPDLEHLNSWAENGEATVRVGFAWGADIDVKKMEVREAVERARPQLPDTLGHISIEGETDGPGGGTILQGRISARRDLSESWELLDRRIGRPLERIKGVARVDLYGVEPQQVRIDLDLDALRRHGVYAGEVLGLINATNRDIDAGVVREGSVRYDVRTVTRFQTAEEIAGLRLGTGQLRIGDVARVELREPRMRWGRHLDRSFAIGIDVYKEPTANTVDTVDRLMARIAEIEQDPQLAGIRLLVWDNAGAEIRTSLQRLRNAGLFGGVLAIGVLFVFLRRVRTTLVVAVAIPFSLLVTCGAMYALGAEFNVLTMLGLMLGVGMLVDNAVVVIENIHRSEGLGLSPARAARTGAREVALAVTASTATTVIVWSWLFVSDRNSLVIYMGAVALTICLAVGCSLLISLTFIPLAASRFVSRTRLRPGWVERGVVPRYRLILEWTLRHRLITLCALFALALSAIYPIVTLEKSGEPRFQTREVPIVYRAHDEVTRETMEGHVDTVEQWLFADREALGFESVYSFYTEDGYARTAIYLAQDEASPEALARLRSQLRDGLPVIPGVGLEVGDRDRWRHQQGHDRRLVSVALHGEDPEYLEDLALDVEQRLGAVDDVVEVWGPTVRGQKELRLLVSAEAAHNLGVTPRGVAETVGFAFRGQQLRRFQRPDGEMEMLIGLPEASQPGLDALADLPIVTADGDTVPLSSVVEITMARTPEHIRREERQTTTLVTVQFDKDAVTTDEGQQRVREGLHGLHLPAGYSWDFGQWGRDRDEVLQTMVNGVLLSLVAVILLMTALFESFSQPFAIIVTLLLAFFGAFWSLWLFGFDLDSIALMGVIILIGIVVNNGIVLVDHVNSLRRQGMERQQALIQGCGDRLRPVAMTAITTIFGLIPLALSGATVASAYIDSVAVAVIGGLTTSTLFTLLALPVWYTTLEDFGGLLKRLLPRPVIGRRRSRSRGVLADLID